MSTFIRLKLFFMILFALHSSYMSLKYFADNLKNNRDCRYDDNRGYEEYE